MAGPLSSEEIEDVVSSVRRLVSNEQKPRPLSRNLNAETLLLTPALRVVLDVSPLAPLVLDAPLIEAAKEPVVDDAPEAAFSSPVADAAESQAPSASEEDSLARALQMDIESDAVIGDVDSGVAASEPVAFSAPEAEWEDEVWTGSDPEPDPLAEVALLAEEAEVMTAPVMLDTESAGTDQVDAWTEDGREWSEDEPVPFVPLRRRAEDLAARLAAGEIAESQRRSDPDLPTADMEAPPDVRLADILMPETGTAEEPLAAFAGFDPSKVAAEFVDADGTPLAVLDEAVLQDIVRQTLRGELHGELGERITRNVRKLVRAEIHRALMARDLD